MTDEREWWREAGCFGYFGFGSGFEVGTLKLSPRAIWRRVGTAARCIAMSVR